jgi:glycosyltransferase involved in cell wall biosynthesis
MNLAFFDTIPWDYDAGTAFERPLGGTQSAACYLSIALAARGHSVSLYTSTTTPRVYEGVKCSAYRTIPRNTFASHDAVIVCNGPADICHYLRPQISPQGRLILWVEHAHDQPVLSALSKPEVQAGWDLIVCVSRWQCESMQRHFGLEPNRVLIIRNAIGPAFTNLFPDETAFALAKSSAPVLAYTSTPYRGLGLLASLFPEVRRLDSRLRLRVFSSMKAYGQDESEDPYTRLYAQCRSTPGIEYVGAIPQPMLAESLKSATILAYPNTFPETSCIAVMEAMAAGLMIVTSDLGALPETTMGTGALVPFPPTAWDLPIYVRAYTDQLIASLRKRGRDPRQFSSAMWKQVRAVTTQCIWPVRAAEWEQMLQSRVGSVLI